MIFFYFIFVDFIYVCNFNYFYREKVNFVVIVYNDKEEIMVQVIFLDYFNWNVVK